MRGTAADDEEPEGPEESMVGKVLASTPDEDSERIRNHDVRKADDEVGEDISPYKTRVADVAVPMRQEVRSKKSARKKPKQYGEKYQSKKYESEHGWMAL